MKRQLNILLVEDDEFDVLMFERSLQRVSERSTLVVAEDGVMALELLRERKVAEPYLSLVDVNMPRMNGLEFLEVLREEARLRDNIVFMFTTSDNPADIARAYRSGVNGYVVKPNSREELNGFLKCLHDFWSMCELPSADPVM